MPYLVIPPEFKPPSSASAGWHHTGTGWTVIDAGFVRERDAAITVEPKNQWSNEHHIRQNAKLLDNPPPAACWLPDIHAVQAFLSQNIDKDCEPGYTRQAGRYTLTEWHPQHYESGALLIEVHKVPVMVEGRVGDYTNFDARVMAAITDSGKENRAVLASETAAHSFCARHPDYTVRSKKDHGYPVVAYAPKIVKLREVRKKAAAKRLITTGLGIPVNVMWEVYDWVHEHILTLPNWLERKSGEAGYSQRNTQRGGWHRNRVDESDVRDNARVWLSNTVTQAKSNRIFRARKNSITPTELANLESHVKVLRPYFKGIRSWDVGTNANKWAQWVRDVEWALRFARSHKQKPVKPNRKRKGRAEEAPEVAPEPATTETAVA